jgi:hypothetical protein
METVGDEGNGERGIERAEKAEPKPSHSMEWSNFT